MLGLVAGCAGGPGPAPAPSAAPRHDASVAAVRTASPTAPPAEAPPTVSAEGLDYGGHMVRAWKRLRAGDVEGAVADFDEAVRLAPGSETTRFSRSHALLAAGRLEEAEADVTAAIDGLHGENHRAALHRALIRKRRQDQAGARADFARVLELTSERRDRQERAARVDALMHLGRPEEALTELDGLVVGMPEAYLVRAHVYRWLGRWEEAHKDLFFFDQMVRDPALRVGLRAEEEALGRMDARSCEEGHDGH